MNRESSPFRVTSNSKFGPSVEWEALPALGERERRSGRAGWWFLISAAIGCWGAVFWVVAQWNG